VVSSHSIGSGLRIIARANTSSMRDRNDLEPTLDAVRDFDKILRVLFGNEDCFDAPAQGREQLLLETGDRPGGANFPSRKEGQRLAQTGEVLRTSK
jgi:hypothetical protein